MNLFKTYRRPHYIVDVGGSEPSEPPGIRGRVRGRRTDWPDYRPDYRPDFFPFYSPKSVEFRFGSPGLARLGAAWLAEVFRAHLEHRPGVVDIEHDVYNEGRQHSVRYRVGPYGHQQVMCITWHVTDDAIEVLGDEDVV